jgi:hypothetical protein
VLTDPPAAVTLSNGDDLAVIAGLDEVAAQVLGKPPECRMAHVALELPNAARREVADDTSVSVEGLFSIVEQPVHHQGRHTALLRAHLGVMGGLRIHVFS